MIILEDEVGLIYKIEFPNKKVYIGQTKRSLHTRMREHRRDDSGCVKLKNALQKYPPEEVYASVLKRDIPVKYLDWWENFYILEYDSIKNGYNIILNDNPAIPLDAAVPEVTVPRHEPKANPFAHFACKSYVPPKKKIECLLPKEHKKEEIPWYMKHLTHHTNA
jgi:hypothetical protein